MAINSEAARYPMKLHAEKKRDGKKKLLEPRLEISSLQ